ncbi:uncharacterized protein [Panulirus ornatus]|uniref:uncharacterized protein isoform X2 n=1 Tax=Panulirus ornatus TaxID=150431 RepID=UPI003A85FF21
MFHHFNLSEPPHLSHADSHPLDTHPRPEAQRHRQEKKQKKTPLKKSLRAGSSSGRTYYQVENEEEQEEEQGGGGGGGGRRGGLCSWGAPGKQAMPPQRIATHHNQPQYHGIWGEDQQRRQPTQDAPYSPEPNHPDIYCQKNLLPCGRRSPTLQQSYSYLGGIMYSPPSDGGLGRNLNGAIWPLRGPLCRPRFLKLLLVVVLLMMAQFSLNILFYRNYDSLFYVNTTSAVSLTSFESRVRWVSSKLPWIHSLSENPESVVQLQYLDTNSSSKPETVTERIATNVLTENEDLDLLKDKEKQKKENNERSTEIELRDVSPLRKIEHDKENERSVPLHKPSVSEPLLVDSKEVHLKASINISDLNVTATSEKLTVKGPSKMSETSIKDQDAKQSKVPQVDTVIKTLPVKSESENGIESNKVLLSKEKPPCPPVPPKLVGLVKIHRTVPALEEQERSHPELEPGGRFRPADCRARHRVAIIIPYRDRIQHLAVFLYHIHPILQRQQIDYAIYAVEQAGSGKFNRAMLLNVGALEALKQYQYDCFIFHDVDLLPEDDRNLYTCPEQPRHMSIAIDSMSYRLPYNDIFGGVSAMTVDQFRTVNGFSNKFWGWGGEDDDMSNRIKYHGFFISRYPANIGRYTMLSHTKDEPNPRRYQYLYEGKKRFKSDGLNSAKYRALDVQLRRLYTWVYVDLYPS